MYLVYLRHVFILIRIEFGTGRVFIPICLNVQRYKNGFSKIYLWWLKDISLPIKSTGFPHNRPYLLNFLKDFTKISFTSFTFTHRMLSINWLPLFNNQISFTFAPISFTFWEITFTFRQISFTLQRIRERILQCRIKKTGRLLWGRPVDYFIRKSYFTFFTLIRYSAIWTAFKAAPFLIWSLTVQKVRPFGLVRSLRILPT